MQCYYSFFDSWSMYSVCMLILVLLFSFLLFIYLFSWLVPLFPCVTTAFVCVQRAPRGDADGRAERSWRPGSWASQQRWRSQREQLPTEPIRPLPIAKWRSGHGKKRYTITIYLYIYLSAFTHTHWDTHFSLCSLLYYTYIPNMYARTRSLFKDFLPFSLLLRLSVCVSLSSTGVAHWSAPGSFLLIRSFHVGWKLPPLQTLHAASKRI